MATRNTADFDAFYQATARRVVLYLFAVCGDLADASAGVLTGQPPRRGVSGSRWWR